MKSSFLSDRAWLVATALVIVLWMMMTHGEALASGAISSRYTILSYVTALTVP